MMHTLGLNAPVSRDSVGGDYPGGNFRYRCIQEEEVGVHKPLQISHTREHCLAL